MFDRDLEFLLHSTLLFSLCPSLPTSISLTVSYHKQTNKIKNRPVKIAQISINTAIFFGFSCHCQRRNRVESINKNICMQSIRQCVTFGKVPKLFESCLMIKIRRMITCSHWLDEKMKLCMYERLRNYSKSQYFSLLLKG